MNARPEAASFPRVLPATPRTRSSPTLPPLSLPGEDRTRPRYLRPPAAPRSASLTAGAQARARPPPASSPRPRGPAQLLLLRGRRAEALPARSGVSARCSRSGSAAPRGRSCRPGRSALGVGVGWGGAGSGAGGSRGPAPGSRGNSGPLRVAPTLDTVERCESIKRVTFTLKHPKNQSEPCIIHTCYFTYSNCYKIAPAILRSHYYEPEIFSTGRPF